jgi:hypothetical protein
VFEDPFFCVYDAASLGILVVKDESTLFPLKPGTDWPVTTSYPRPVMRKFFGEEAKEKKKKKL